MFTLILLGVLTPEVFGNVLNSTPSSSWTSPWMSTPIALSTSTLQTMHSSIQTETTSLSSVTSVLSLNSINSNSIISKSMTLSSSSPFLLETPAMSQSSSHSPSFVSSQVTLGLSHASVSNIAVSSVLEINSYFRSSVTSVLSQTFSSRSVLGNLQDTSLTSSFVSSSTVSLHASPILSVVSSSSSSSSGLSGSVKDTMSVNLMKTVEESSQRVSTSVQASTKLFPSSSLSVTQSIPQTSSSGSSQEGSGMSSQFSLSSSLGNIAGSPLVSFTSSVTSEISQSAKASFSANAGSSISHPTQIYSPSVSSSSRNLVGETHTSQSLSKSSTVVLLSTETSLLAVTRSVTHTSVLVGSVTVPNATTVVALSPTTSLPQTLKTFSISTLQKPMTYSSQVLSASIFVLTPRTASITPKSTTLLSAVGTVRTPSVSAFQTTKGTKIEVVSSRTSTTLLQLESSPFSRTSNASITAHPTASITVVKDSSLNFSQVVRSTELGIVESKVTPISSKHVMQQNSTLQVNATAVVRSTTPGLLETHSANVTVSKSAVSRSTIRESQVAVSHRASSSINATRFAQMSTTTVALVTPSNTGVMNMTKSRISVTPSTLLEGVSSSSLSSKIKPSSTSSIAILSSSITAVTPAPVGSNRLNGELKMTSVVFKGKTYSKVSAISDKDTVEKLRLAIEKSLQDAFRTAIEDKTATVKVTKLRDGSIISDFVLRFSTNKFSNQSEIQTIFLSNITRVNVTSIQGDQLKVRMDKDGLTLTGIDECKSGVSRCDKQATCQDLALSYKCTCKDGYDGNGFYCDKKKKNVMIIVGITLAVFFGALILILLFAVIFCLRGRRDRMQSLDSSSSFGQGNEDWTNIDWDAIVPRLRAKPSYNFKQAIHMEKYGEVNTAFVEDGDQLHRNGKSKNGVKNGGYAVNGNSHMKGENGTSHYGYYGDHEESTTI